LPKCILNPGHIQHAALRRRAEAGTNMADRIIVYWRDIPAQVIIKKGRATAKRELSLRFTEAIDMCAMRTGAAETDDYLAEWRKADPIPVSDDLEAEADKAVQELETAFDRERLVALVKAGGRNNG
jgi:hypothetical protein